MSKTKKLPIDTSRHYKGKRKKKIDAKCKSVEEAVGLTTFKEMGSGPNSMLGDVKYFNNLDIEGGRAYSCVMSAMFPQKALKYGYNTIGRSSKNDIVVNDLFVSRIHCTLLVHSDGTAEIFDLASANGTFVNGEKIKRIFLKSSDKIQIGETEITISLDDGSFLN